MDVASGPGGVPDLGALKRAPVDEQTAEGARIEWEARNGLRCRGCGERMEHGLEFMMPKVERTPEGVVVMTRRLFACGGEQCPAASRAIQEGAVVMREVRQMFLDEGPAAAVLQGKFPAAPPQGEPEPDGPAAA